MGDRPPPVSARPPRGTLTDRGIVSITPLDVWPLQNTSSFELRPGQTAVSPNEPRPLTSKSLPPLTAVPVQGFGLQFLLGLRV